jgi:hypothetical protein
MTPQSFCMPAQTAWLPRIRVFCRTKHAAATLLFPERCSCLNVTQLPLELPHSKLGKQPPQQQ